MEQENSPQNESNDGDIQTALDAIGSYISALANEAVSNKVWIEDRHLEDMRQLEGLDVKVKHPHNITKPKQLQAEARIGDMLFQQGDKNFTIVPDEDTPAELRQQAEQGSDLLEKNITNKFDESDYESVGRKCIQYATQLGVGVIQGPTTSIVMDRTWVQQRDTKGKPINAMVMRESKKATVEHVETWNYFPDMSAAVQEDCAYEFRRRFMTKLQLQKLLLRDDFNRQAILDIINKEPSADPPRYITELRDDNLPQVSSENYIIWEGDVTIPVEMLRKLCDQCGTDDGNHYVEEDLVDENFDIDVHAWCSDSGKLLKIAPLQLETDERTFSVFCYDRDTTCFMASKGIPRLLRTVQRDIDHSWERIHDNSDLAVGPQWIADTSLVEPLPVEGEKLSWKMTGNKGWRSKKPGADMSKAFHVFNIPSGVEENMVILQQALRFADTETNLPQIAGGEVSPEQTRMSHETFSMLFNAAGAIPRRIIKDWDDYVTVPLVGRFIDYIMQYEPQEAIQGKFIPNAQGSSGLIMKETLTKNAMSLAGVAASNPKFAEKTDWGSLYSTIIRGMQFDPNAVTYTEEELAKQREENPPQPSAEQIEAQANMLEAQNEKAKLQVTQKQDARKHELSMRELSLKEKKAKADANVAMLKLQLERDKLKQERQGKIVEKMVDGKVKAETEKLKANTEKEKIVLETKGKESLQTSEFLLEGQREDAQVNKT